MVYKTKGVCAQGIEFEIDDNKKVHNIKFTGGCSGNTQGVAQLAEGMDADEVISRLEGIRCGFKPTSCPDQLAKAIRQPVEIVIPVIAFRNQYVTDPHRFSHI